jgi:integrative and conjugative element protein (TIGR02256 family)
VRSKKGTQPQINKAWKKSRGTEIYLGEWHTHFEVNPTPSLTDKNMVKNSLRKTIMEIDFLFLIIVGLNRTIWVGKQTKEGLIELNEVV